MAESLALPRGFKTLTPQPEITRYYNIAGTPYTGTAQVLSEVVLAARYEGQFFRVGHVDYEFSPTTADADLVVKGATASIISNTQSGTTYTLLASDNGKQIITTNSAAVVITVPTGLPTGFNCDVFQQGTGQVSFVGSGITLRYTSFELPSIVERYGDVGIQHIQNVSNEYKLVGQLSSI